MNEMLNDSLAFDRYTNDLKRAEANYQHRTAKRSSKNGPRFQIALALLSLATRIQPALSVQIQRPAGPATA